MENTEKRKYVQNKDEMRVLGERLREIRAKSGYSRQFIQDKYGIPAASIKIWENGLNEPGILKVKRYLSIFTDKEKEISLDQLAEMD